MTTERVRNNFYGSVVQVESRHRQGAERLVGRASHGHRGTRHEEEDLQGTVQVASRAAGKNETGLEFYFYPFHKLRIFGNELYLSVHFFILKTFNCLCENKTKSRISNQ